MKKILINILKWLFLILFLGAMIFGFLLVKQAGRGI